MAQKTADPTAPNLIDAVFTGHPSSLQIPSDVENLVVPVSYAIPEKDNQVTKEQAEIIKKVVEETKNNGGPVGEVRIYENCAHGFCVRADVNYKDGEVARKAALAEDQAIAWFEKHLKRK